MVGVGRTVMGAVSSLSCPASQVPRRCYSVRDGGMVTEVSGWDPGHIHCGSGSLTPSTLGVVARRLAFNAFVRRAVGRRSRLSLVPRDGLERGGDGSPLEGRSTTLERGGGALRDRGSREGPSSEAENELPARGYIRYPRARRRLVTCSRVDLLPSSEAEIARRA